MKTYLDIGVLKDGLDGTREHDLKSVGGAIVMNKYFECGGENENFVSYAPEDKELYYRCEKLGFSIERIRGCIFHIDHFIGKDSYIHHEDYENNLKEFDKIQKMTTDELKAYYCSLQRP